NRRRRLVNRSNGDGRLALMRHRAARLRTLASDRGYFARSARLGGAPLRDLVNDGGMIGEGHDIADLQLAEPDDLGAALHVFDGPVGILQRDGPGLLIDRRDRRGLRDVAGMLDGLLR